MAVNHHLPGPHVRVQRYRAFFVSRVAGLFASPRFGSVFAVAAGGVVFGVTHFLEGPVGIFSNGSFGLLFCVNNPRTAHNLWVTIIAHGLLNTVRFILVFAGATGQRDLDAISRVLRPQ